MSLEPAPGRRWRRRLQGAVVVVAVAMRPWLWWTAARQVARLAAPGWWRRSPWLPMPDRDYLRFRLETQYGDPEHPAQAGDVVAYLAWCRHEPSGARFR